MLIFCIWQIPSHKRVRVVFRQDVLVGCSSDDFLSISKIFVEISTTVDISTISSLAGSHFSDVAFSRHLLLSDVAARISTVIFFSEMKNLVREKHFDHLHFVCPTLSLGSKSFQSCPPISPKISSFLAF